MHFRFHALPPELKRSIWELALPELQSEVCIVWPPYREPAAETTATTTATTATGPDPNVDPARDQAAPPMRPRKLGVVDELVLPLLVDTAVPVLMHVCREWRAYVFAAAAAGYASGTFPLRFRASRRAGCRVPCRAFVPELDVLYVGAGNFERALLPRSRRGGDGASRRDGEAGDRDGQGGDDGSGDGGGDILECGIGLSTLARVRHLAVDRRSMQLLRQWMPELLFGGCRHLERVSVLYPMVRSKQNGSWHIRGPGGPPPRRCQLLPVQPPRSNGSTWLSWTEQVIGSREQPVARQEPDARQEPEARQEANAEAGQKSEAGQGNETPAQDEHRSGYRMLYSNLRAQMAWRHRITQSMVRRFWVFEVDRRNGATDWYTGSAWNKEEQRLRVKFRAAVFYEFRRAEDGQELWECGLNPEPVSWPTPPGVELFPNVKITNNPEEWRVNDDWDYPC